MVGCAGIAAGPGGASPAPAPAARSSGVEKTAPEASSVAPVAPQFEQVADGFGLSSPYPWGALANTGARTLAISDSGSADVVTLLELQGTSAVRQNMQQSFSSPVSAGGEWPRAWLAARFDFARQSGASWQARKLSFPPNTDELLTARAWLGGRVLGLFVPGNRYSGANLRGGAFAVIDGRAGGEPDLHAASCQDCRSIFALDFDALPSGQVYVVGERDGQATFLEFLPTGGRGIFVPTPAFEPVAATYGPNGKVTAVSTHEVYFGAGHWLPIVYRYDGTKVEALPVPADLPSSVDPNDSARPIAPVMGLAARPGGDLWAIFGTRFRNVSGFPTSRLYRYDRGGQWQQAKLPPRDDGKTPNLVDVAVTDDSVWVLGQFDDAGVLYRSALAPRPGAALPTPPAVTAGKGPSYGAVSGSFSCGGDICSGSQVCCEFGSFQRCVTPNTELPAEAASFANAATELVKSCRVDDFGDPAWQVDVCTASSDCEAGRLCVSPESPSFGVAYCAASMPLNGTELCREGLPCAEAGSICRQRQCVRLDAKVDCATQTCGTGQVCCAEAQHPGVVRCQRLDQCWAIVENRPLTFSCSSRQHCASGRRCALVAYSSTCVDMTDIGDWEGLLCASNAECDLLDCPGAGRARCIRDVDSKLNVCKCPQGKSKP